MPYKDPEVRKVKAREYSRNHYLKNKDTLLITHKEYRDNTKEARKIYWDDYYMRNYKKLYTTSGWNKHLKRTYGITEPQYNQMCVDQNNKCKICDTEVIGDKKLYVDHDHETNKIRNLLCQPCNSGLGFFKDDPQLLEKAKQYLYSHTNLMAGAA